MVKRKIRFRLQKSDFHGVSEKGCFHKARCPWSHCQSWLFGFLPASLEEDAEPVTEVGHVLMFSTCSLAPGQSVCLWEKDSAQTRRDFWRWESQGVKYLPSDAQLPSLRKSPSGKLEVDSVQAGRRARDPLQWPEGFQDPASAELEFSALHPPSSADPRSTCLEVCLFQVAWHACPSEAAIEEWKDLGWS